MPEKHRHCQKCGLSNQTPQRLPSERFDVKETYICIVNHSRTVVSAVKEKVTAAEAPPSAPRGEKRELSQTTVVTEAILNNLEYDTMGDSWLAALEPEFQKPYFVQVNLHCRQSFSTADFSHQAQEILTFRMHEPHCFP